MNGTESGRKKVFRSTKTRRTILAILSKNPDRAFSVEELHSACLKEVSANLSTIYRTIYTLSDLGIITKTIRPNGRTYVQLALPEKTIHGHHIVCTQCKKVADIDVCPLIDFEKKIASQTGFLVTSHSIELNGICPACKAQKK